MPVRKNKHELAARQSKKLFVMPDLNTPEKQREIADLAFEFWLARGFRDGSPAEDLLRAEREIKMRALKLLKRKRTKPAPVSQGVPSEPPTAAVIPELPAPPVATAPCRMSHRYSDTHKCRVCDDLLLQICLQAQAWAESARAAARAAMETYQHDLNSSVYETVKLNLKDIKSRYFELVARRNEHLAVAH